MSPILLHFRKKFIYLTLVFFCKSCILFSARARFVWSTRNVTMFSNAVSHKETWTRELFYGFGCVSRLHHSGKTFYCGSKLLVLPNSRKGCISWKSPVHLHLHVERRDLSGVRNSGGMRSRTHHSVHAQVACKCCQRFFSKRYQRNIESHQF